MSTIGNQLYNLMESYWPIKIILSATEIGLFKIINDNSLSAKKITKMLKTDLEGTTFLLDSLCSLEILFKNQNKYSLSKKYLLLLNSKCDKNIISLLEYNVILWKHWNNLTKIIKKGRIPIKISENHFKNFISTMHTISKDKAKNFVDKINLKNVKKLIDIGGASGTYSMSFLEKKPELDITLIDWHSAITVAEEFVDKGELSNRIKLYRCDFIRDQIPGNYDLAFLSAVIHIYTRSQNKKLYKKIFKSLNNGGRLIIRDHIMSTDHTKPKEGALFAINMLVATNNGRCFTFKEIKEDLEDCGFKTIKIIMDQGGKWGSLIECIKP